MATEAIQKKQKHHFTKPMNFSDTDDLSVIYSKHCFLKLKQPKLSSCSLDQQIREHMYLRLLNNFPFMLLQDYACTQLEEVIF